MQTRNLVIFILASLLLVTGWNYLLTVLWPPPPKPAPPVPEPRAQVPAAVTWPWRKQPAAVQTEIAVRLIATGVGPEAAPRLATEVARLLEAPPAEVQKPAAQPPVVPAEKPQQITLGDDSYFLNVELTSKGASARQIVLTRFQAADDFGLAMWQPGQSNQKVPLTLAPPYQVLQRLNQPPAGQPQVVHDFAFPCQHYALLHYASPEDQQPLDTLGQRVWRVVRNDQTPAGHVVAFETELPDPGVRITKTFTLAPGDYHLGLVVRIERTGAGDAKFRYQLTGAHGLPVEGVWYAPTFRSAMFGLEDKKGALWRLLEDSRQIGSWQVGGETHERGERTIRYAGIVSQYFASVVAVDSGQPSFVERARATVVGALPGKDKPPPQPPPFPWAPINAKGEPNAQLPFLADINVRLVSEPLPLAGGAVEHRYLLYNGPVKVRLLGHMEGADAVADDLVNRYETTLHLGSLTDYPSPGFFGAVGKATGLSWVIIWFTNRMHWLLRVLHVVLPYGLAIVALTVIVRGLMFPISRRQAASAKELQEKMAKLAPEMKKIQEKYKDDFNELNQARLELYKKHHINPFAQLGGCLLLLAQMPVFLGLYYCLQESFFFRLDRFLWIPSLSAPDMLAWWGQWWPISAPTDVGGLLYLGPYLNLLPILTIALFIIQQKIMMPPPTDDQQEMQQNMMKYMMVFIGIMFYKVPAGLCIYFIASTLWGLAERRFLPQRHEPAAGAPPEEEHPGSGARRKPKPSAPPAANGWKQKLRDWWGDLLREAGKQQQARRAYRDDRSEGKKTHH